MSYVTYTSADLDFAVSPVTFDDGGPTTLVGATVSVDALNLTTGLKYHGTATVTSATSMRCTFNAGDLPAGRYEVQAHVTIGSVDQVISASVWTVKPGAI